MKDCSITNEDMVMNYKRIGQNVKRIRSEMGISQLQLALYIGHKSGSTVTLSENVKNNKHFNLEQLFKIANVLEIDICEFLK